MSLAPEPSLHQRVTNALLTVDPAQRIRVAQAGLAMAVMLLGVVLLTYAARVGGTSLDAVLAWAVFRWVARWASSWPFAAAGRAVLPIPR